MALHRFIFGLGLVLAQGAAGASERPSELASAALPNVVMGLAGVVLVILAVAWLARRVLQVQPTAGGQMRVVGGLSLGPRERVVLVQVGPTQMVLGVSPGRIQTLHVLDEPLDLARPESPAPGFAAQLRALMDRREGGGDSHAA